VIVPVLSRMTVFSGLQRIAGADQGVYVQLQITSTIVNWEGIIFDVPCPQILILCLGNASAPQRQHYQHD
jgi:hypothetical protein